MAKKTTTKSKPAAAAKREVAPITKPKAAVTPSPNGAAAPAEAKPPVAAKRQVAPATKPKATGTPSPNGATAPAEVKTVKPATPAKTEKPVAAKAKQVVKKAPPKVPSFTQDDVALRAYFISEKRHAQGLPGDEHQDWLEAERQILAESTGKKKAKTA